MKCLHKFYLRKKLIKYEQRTLDGLASDLKEFVKNIKIKK